MADSVHKMPQIRMHRLYDQVRKDTEDKTMTKTFFHKDQAERFAADLKNSGYEVVRIWEDRDGFRQNVYIVEWY